jgi:hypothetical protein
LSRGRRAQWSVEDHTGGDYLTRCADGEGKGTNSLHSEAATDLEGWGFAVTTAELEL